MSASATKFDDGVAYEEWMGRWSRIVGVKYLEWLAPASELKWLDVGCGNGAFTDLVLDKCDPFSVHGVDPSQEQLDAANSRSSSNKVRYGIGEAQALPFDDDTFDVVAMALAINLPPDPNLAVKEMVRVTKPGGYVGTYMWDIPNGGITMEPIRVALAEIKVCTPIFGEAVTSRDNMRELWENAGLNKVDSTRIDIELSYRSFDAFWDSNTRMANTVARAIQSLRDEEIQILKSKLQSSLPTDAKGHIRYRAFANAVKGKVC